MVRRHALVLGALWVAGATVATSVGLVAVRLVGDQVGDSVSSPLNGDAVRDALTQVSHSPHVEPSPDATGTDEELGPVRSISTRGGELGARCRDDVPGLLYATPADGYRTERDGRTLVRFVGARRVVTVRLSCDDERLLTRVAETSPRTTVTRTPTPLATRSADATDGTRSATPEADDR